MTSTPKKPPKKPPVSVVKPESEEVLADNAAHTRKGGLENDDELLAQSGKKGGLTDDDTELA